jgi:hypothetical protein
MKLLTSGRNFSYTRYSQTKHKDFAVEASHQPRTAVPIKRSMEWA